ncbi:DUF4336 domain-containing protein [Vibrio rotiferianus]|uniref:DUF4336 domain-containing protein n=2 Tax=Vibrio rotiferianus TaxID=190895 RepID=A0A7Y3ZDP6_9VIBR|nr:DUF4336 domain-containing protein [Vibrio rotiferianus]
MTIVRLSWGELWVHSPIKLNDLVRNQVNSLGTVKFLVAPNHLHHLFIADWQCSYPEAITYGTAEVIKKRKDLAFDYSLNEEQNWPWFPEIQQVLFTGSPLMEECVFFHKASEVLIVTDLIENFPPRNFNCWQRLVARGVGILAPHGKMPIDWRISFMFGKKHARKHLSSIIRWHPKKIIMSHGEIVEEQAVKFLDKSFSWLI